MRRNGIAENAGLGLSIAQINQINALDPVAQTKMIQRYNTAINVFDYGALGDLVTDDADAFQAAIDAAELLALPIVVPAATGYLVALHTRTAWLAATVYTVGTIVTNSGRVYECITGGSSAGSGGPTTTAADITDGTVHWKFRRRGTGALVVTASAKVSIVGDSRAAPKLKLAHTEGELFTIKHNAGSELTLENLVIEGPTAAPAVAQFSSGIYATNKGKITLRNVEISKFRNDVWVVDSVLNDSLVFEMHGGSLTAYGSACYFHDGRVSGDGEARFFDVTFYQNNDTALVFVDDLHCIYLTMPVSLYVNAGCRFLGAENNLIVHNSGTTAPKYTVIEGGYYQNAETAILGNSQGVTLIGPAVIRNCVIGVRTAGGGSVMNATRFQGGGIGGGQTMTYAIYEHTAENVQMNGISVSGAYVAAGIFRLLNTTTRWTISGGKIAPSSGNGIKQDDSGGDSPEWVVTGGCEITNAYANCGKWIFGDVIVTNAVQPSPTVRAMEMHFEGTQLVGSSLLNLSDGVPNTLTLTGRIRLRDTAKIYAVASANLKGNLQLTHAVNPSVVASAATLYLNPKYTVHHVNLTNSITNLYLEDATYVSHHACAAEVDIIADAAVPISAAGNIVPRGGIGRTLSVGEVFRVRYDNPAGKWREAGAWT